MDRRIVTIDWVSRLFSIVGVLGALGIGLYLYNGTQRPALDNAAIAKLVDDKFAEDLDSHKEAILNQVTTTVAQEYDRRYSEHTDQLKKLNQQANDGLFRFQEDARETLASFDKAAEDERLKRSGDFADLLADMRAKIDDSDGGAIALDPPDNKTDVDADSDEDDPSLRVAVLALRPVADSDGSQITIQNTGGQSATITSVTFQPTENYKPRQVDANDNSILYDSTVVVFSADDNQATIDGQHKDYVKSLSPPITIPAGKTMVVRLEIDNPKHIGWGFTGTLSLAYEDGTLEVDNARARFVDKLEDSI